MKNKFLIIFGTKSTAIEIEETARLYLPNYKIMRIFYSEDFIERNIEIQNAVDQKIEIEYIISFKDVIMRSKCEEKLHSLPNFSPKSIIHPAAYISASAIVEKGCYIAANAVVSSNASIAPHVMINFNVTIGHDTILHKHVSILPGARVSGSVIVGEGTVLGANSFIFQNVTIGKNNMIDALTSIHKNLEDNMISAARVTKSFKQVKNK